MSDDGGRRLQDGGRTEDGGRDRIDLAIDHAVREILDVEQPAGVRYRVLRRIASPVASAPVHWSPVASAAAHPSPVASAPAHSSPVGSAFRRKFFWLGAPLAAAAAIVLAVLLSRGTERPEAPVTVATSAPRATRAVKSPVTSAPATVPATTVERRNVVGRARRSIDRTVVAAATFDRAQAADTEIAPLNEIDPIRVTELTESPIAPAPIAVRPLNPITALQVAPLTPPDGRN